jgi:hypothetical protein
MRIKRFEAAGIHGYLNFGVDFNHDITFLFGINGSGKTTVLRAIVSLLAPDIIWLANANFENLSLSLYIDESEILIPASKNSELLYLRYGDKEHQESDQIPWADIQRLTAEDLDSNRFPAEFFRDRLAAILGETKALRLIEQLPTPTFLGLERTTLPLADDRLSPRGSSRRSPMVFSRSRLDEGIREADSLISAELRRILTLRNKLSERLRADNVIVV